MSKINIRCLDSIACHMARQGVGPANVQNKVEKPIAGQKLINQNLLQCRELNMISPFKACTLSSVWLTTKLLQAAIQSKQEI